MNQTPVLEIGEDLVLNPATRKVLPQVIDAHNEDPEGTLAALPWLKEDIEFSPQIADLSKNLELELTWDEIHFWAIQGKKDNAFHGFIGLGNDMHLAASAYNIGYWVRKRSRGKGISLNAVDEIIKWLRQRKEQSLIELTVHPHNVAGLATAKRVCQKWNGLAIEGYIGVEIKGRTVPHLLNLIQLRRSDDE